jgi:hypothetical protein
MPRHQRVLADAPLVVHHAQVAVANPAVFHLDFHRLFRQGTGVVIQGFEGTTGGVRRIGMDHGFARDGEHSGF